MQISPYNNVSSSSGTTSHNQTFGNRGPTLPTTSNSGIKVSELLPERCHKRRALSIKLTDECLAAINEAIRNEWRIRMTVTKEAISIHIGNNTATPLLFHCSHQAMPGTVDAIYRDRSTADTYQTVSSVSTKLVVNATEKTFAETREKAQKLAEEESKKTIKDMVIKDKAIGKYRSGAAKTTAFRPTSGFKPSTTTTLKPSSTLTTDAIFTPAPVSSTQKRISPPFSAFSATATQPNRTSSPSVSQSKPNGHPNGTKPPPVPVQNRQELIRKPLRERCIHLLATGKYKMLRDLLNRLKYEGAPKQMVIQDFLNNAEAIINQVSEYDATNDSLILRPQFYKEVNLRWPWFLSSEREHLRRLIVPAAVVEESTSVAPMRRNEIAAPLAPSSSSSASEKPKSNEIRKNHRDAKADRQSTASTTAAAKLPEKENSMAIKPSDKKPDTKISSSKFEHRQVAVSTTAINNVDKMAKHPVKEQFKSAITETQKPMTSLKTVPNKIDKSAKSVSRSEEKPTHQLAKSDHSTAALVSDKLQKPRISSSSNLPSTAPKKHHDKLISSTKPKVNGVQVSSTTTTKKSSSNVATVATLQNSEKLKRSSSIITTSSDPRSNPVTLQKRVRSPLISSNDTKHSLEVKQSVPPEKRSRIDDITMAKRPPAITVQSTGSMSDWEKQFPQARNFKQAVRYHEMFEMEYPQYRKYHEELKRVSTEFESLRLLFDRAVVGSTEQTELLGRIQQAYKRYQNDSKFTETRRRHNELYPKLMLLKRRVAEWEQSVLVNQDTSSKTLQHTANYHRGKSASPGDGSLTYTSSAASTASVESDRHELFN